MFSHGREKRGVFALIVLSSVLIITLVGCADKPSALNMANRPKYGGELNYLLGEPVSIDPALAKESEGVMVVKQLFDGLTDYDPKTLAIRPAVASSWRSSPGGDEWVFYLRHGVKFHNGREVTAQDFINAWNRVASKKVASPLSYHMSPIKGFSAVRGGRKSQLSGLSSSSRYILKVKLNYRFAEFPTVVGHPVFSPVPIEEIRKNGDDFAQKPIGNGPFFMEEPWRHNQAITIRKFKRYYGEKPYLLGVNFKIIENRQTAFLEFKGGALDYSFIPNNQVKATTTQYGRQAIIGKPQLMLHFYGFNLQKAPFKNNKKLRQAINYAINRRSIVDNVYEGAYVAAGNIVPPAIAGSDKSAPKYSFSPRRARLLFREAGYPKGKGLPLIKLAFAIGRGHEQPARVVRENLRDFGAKVDLVPLESGAFLKALRDGKISMFADTWNADYPSADSFLYQLFYSKSEDNAFGFSDAKVDDLLIQARQAIEPLRRRQLYSEAEKRILGQAPLAPLAFVGTRVVHAPDVKGFVRTPLDDTPLDRVWLSE